MGHDHHHIGGDMHFGGVVSSAPSTTAPAAGSEAATVIVRGPEGLKITFNGKEIARKSTEDSFSTPALVRGQAYTYEVIAREGSKDPVTRTVTVRAGQQSVVDFGAAAPAPAVAKSEGESARVTVIAPRGTKLSINDTSFTVDGRRTFETPKLDKGQKYYYTVKAEVAREGRTVNESRRIDIEAGKSVTVDFTTASTRTASR